MFVLVTILTPVLVLGVLTLQLEISIAFVTILISDLITGPTTVTTLAINLIC